MQLPPAVRGLTAAAPHATSFAVAPLDPKVHLVRTPDPMREVTEAVREVQSAVAEGVPYDRIALVLPDAAEAVTLREALERAGIPATWQTGPALASAPAARFVLHALGLRAGEDSVRAWYELLRLPLLRLRANAGETVARGRGRWRGLLAKCGAYRGSETILAALDAYQAERARGEEDAERLQKELQGKGFAAYRIPRGSKLTVVFVGPYKSSEIGESARSRLQQQVNIKGLLVRRKEGE